MVVFVAAVVLVVLVVSAGATARVDDPVAGLPVGHRRTDGGVANVPKPQPHNPGGGRSIVAGTGFVGAGPHADWQRNQVAADRCAANGPHSSRG